MSDYTISLSINATDNASAALGSVASSLQSLEGVSLDGLDTASQNLLDLDAAAGSTDNIDGAATSMNDMDNAAKNAGNSIEDVGSKTSRTSNFMGNLKSEITGAITAFGLMEVVGKIGEFYELGTSVSLASGTFTELSNGAAGAQVNMDLLRQSTGGMVDDLTLMQGANKLLMMGLAENGQQAAELIQIAVTLGRAMGQDAGAAIQDFAALLANQSTPRLDNFGISSDKVRARLEELKDAGMGASEAFAMATLEQGRLAMDRIGQAAGPAATAVDRFGTSLRNIAEEGAARFTTGVNSIAGILEVAAGQNPIQQQQRAQAEAQKQSFMDEYYGLFTDAFSRAGGDVGTGETANMYKNQFAEMYDSVRDNPELLQDPTFLGDYLTNIPERYRQQFADAWLATYLLAQSEAEAQAANTARTGRINAAMASAAGYDAQGGDYGGGMAEVLKNQNIAANYDAITAFYQSGGDARLSTQDRLNQMERESQQRHYEEWLQEQREFQAKKESAERESQAMFESMSSGRNQAFMLSGLGDSPADYERLAGMSSKDLAAAMPEYMQQGNADAITQQYEQAQQHLERMKELASQGLIGDDEVTKAQALADQLGVMSNTAQDAAAAFKNLSLSDVFGQQSGGMAGEMSDMVMQQLQNSGMSPEKMAAIQQQLDLSTGRETASSVAMSDTVAPMIAELAQTDPAAAAQAMQNAQAFLQQATLLGLSEAEIAKSLPAATGISGGSMNANFDAVAFANGVKYGIGPSPATAAGGSPFASPLFQAAAGAAGATGTPMAGFGPSPATAGGATGLGALPGAQAGAAGAAGAGAASPMQGLRNDAQGMLQVVEQIKAAIAQIGGTRKLTLDLGVNDSQGVMALIKALFGGSSLAAVVSANGGTVPGTGNGRGPGRPGRD